MEAVKNYYGSLCTEMYEILHKDAPQDELSFYLSYAEKEMKILEPLCGSGRFLVPFLERGFDICGMDLSAEMLTKLKEKAPTAKVIQADILKYDSGEKFDYIFICSGSVSLFTNMKMCKEILQKMKCLLKKDGKFVFAVETVADRCPDDLDYKTLISVKTEEGYELILKMKNYYDEKTHTQYSPSIYELYDKWCSDNGFGIENKGNFIAELKSKGIYASSGTVGGKTVKNIVKGYTEATEFIEYTGSEPLPFD